MKRTVGIILSVMLCLCLFACGGDTDKAETPSDQAEVTESAAYEVPQDCIDATIEDMKNNDYIEDVGISIKDGNISIAVQVPDSIKTDYIEMAGEDTARYLASQINMKNSEYAPPGSDSIGGIYDDYTLLVTVFSSSKTINESGAATDSSKIIW